MYTYIYMCTYIYTHTYIQLRYNVCYLAAEFDMKIQKVWATTYLEIEIFPSNMALVFKHS